MTAPIRRRIEKLEVVTDTATVTLLFVAWPELKAELPGHLETEWKGERLTQQPGESDQSFRRRVHDVVSRDRPASNCAAVLWVQSAKTRP